MRKSYKYLFIFFIVMPSVVEICAQNMDSLKLAFKNAKHDTMRCFILDAMIEIENEDSIWPKYNDQLLRLAQKNIPTENTALRTVYYKYYANALNNIGFFAANQRDFPKALEYYNQSLKIHEKIGYQNGVAYALNNMASIYDDQGYFLKSLYYYQRSRRVLNQINDKKGLAFCFNNIAIIYYNHGDIQMALEYYDKTLELAKEMQDKNGMAYALIDIGIVYNELGNLSIAIDYFHKAFKVYEEINDKSGIGVCLIYIGDIYDRQGDLIKALEYYNKSLKVNEQIKDERGIASSLNSLGDIYNKKGNVSKALDYHEKSLKILEEIQDQGRIANTLNSIGSIYNSQGNITTALEYYQKGLEIQVKIQDKKGLPKSLNEIAMILMANGQTTDAIYYANQSLQKGKELGFPEIIRNSAKTLKVLYEKQSNYKGALSMHELEIKMKDSINNQQALKIAIKNQFQDEFEKEESIQKARQDKLDIIANAELKQKEKERNYFIAGFVLVLMGVAFVFRSYRLKQKANKIISEQKKLVDEKQKEVLDSIRYAKRIQTALLPTEKYIEKCINQLR